jgi:hypothetical protein
MGFHCRPSLHLCAFLLLSSRCETLPVDFSTFVLAGNGVGPATFSGSGASSTLTLTPAIVGAANAAWAPVSLDVTRSFSCTFTLTLVGSAGADGVVLALHNDPRGRAAYGGSGGLLGAFGGAGTAIGPSISLAVRTYQTSCVGYCGGLVVVSGAGVASPALPGAAMGTTAGGTGAATLGVSLAYTPCNGGLLTWNTYNNYANNRGQLKGNLSVAVGNRSSAIWGFTGSTGGSFWAHKLSLATITSCDAPCAPAPAVDFSAWALAGLQSATHALPSLCGGRVDITGASTDQANALWCPSPLDLTVPWQINATMTPTLTTAPGADGFAVVLHADGRGFSALGANGGSIGAYGGTNGIKPSFGMGVLDYQLTAPGFRVALDNFQGSVQSGYASAGATPGMLNLSLSYDPCACTVAFSTQNSGVVTRGSRFMNLVGWQGVGRRVANWGFAGGTGGAVFVHSLSAVTLTASAPARCAGAGQFLVQNWTLLGTAWTCAPGNSVLLTVANAGTTLGSASAGCLGGSCYSAGAAWAPSRVNIRAPFSITVAVDIGMDGVVAGVGADGFALVLHNDPRGLAAIGGTGGGLGVWGVGITTISPAFGFFVRDYQSAFVGLQGGFFFQPFPGAAALQTVTTLPPPMTLSLTLSYDPCTCVLAINASVNGTAAFSASTVVSLSAVVNPAANAVLPGAAGSEALWWGVTAATGGSGWTHALTGASMAQGAPGCTPFNFTALGSAAACGLLTQSFGVGQPTQVGALWAPTRLNTSLPFTISTNLSVALLTGVGADGAAIVVHADPRGAAALGAPGRSVGVAAYSQSSGVPKGILTGVTPSFAAMVRDYQLDAVGLMGRLGSSSGGFFPNAAGWGSTWAAAYSDALALNFSYNACTCVASVSAMSSAGLATTKAVGVNLALALSSPTALVCQTVRAALSNTPSR